MKIGAISKWGDIFCELERMNLAGHEVLLWIDSAEHKDLGNGFVRKAATKDKIVEWADIIVVDGTGYGEEADRWRKEGRRVVNGSHVTDRMEEDRAFGMKLAQQLGMRVPESSEFGSIREAINHIERQPAAYAVKMSGADSPATTLVSETSDSEDVLLQLDSFMRHPQQTQGMKAVCVQRKIKGIEIGVACWANGNGFVQPHNIYFEHKTLMNDDVGPNTGEMGTACINLDTKSRAWSETLGLAQPLVEKIGYLGQLALGTIYDGENFWFLEFSARQGWPSTHIEAELINGGYLVLFQALIGGVEPKGILRVGEWAVGVVVSAPGYPWVESYEANGKALIVGGQLCGKNHLAEVKCEDGGQIVTTGTCGVIVVSVGTGTSLKSAIEKAYRNVDRVVLPNKQYRTDIGKRVLRDWKQIEALIR